MDSRELGVRARSALSGTRFADLQWVAETGSTNADLLVEAAAGAAEGRVRATEHQNAGRGRRDRTWEDQPGSALMVSVLLRPTLAPAQLARLTMAWGLAALDGCRAVTGIDLALKWPNDVVNPADDRKLAGVLAEATFSGSRLDAVVIGMGLNANGGVPAALADRAVSLDVLAGHPIDREMLLIELLRSFDARYSGIEEPSLDADYRRCSATIGRAVRVELDHEIIEGRAVDVTDTGQLVVVSDARRHLISAGDVVHLRPA